MGKTAETIGMLRFTCGCGKSLKAPARLAGKASRCPACGAAVIVPQAALVLGGEEFALKPESSQREASASSDSPRRNPASQNVFETIDDSATLA
ncbi:MAG: hypothetical protein ACM3U2_18930, partial [Deltaproteobacteria bacterium]